MDILFVNTGGTIDKDYPHTTKGWAFEFGEPAIIRILQRVNPSFQYYIETPFQKDSLEIKEEDRLQLLDLIQSRKQSKIILTHGTDTMIETARYLKARVPEKLIILTGAMRPERFTNSDAAFNLGAAIAAVNILHQGVFVCMNGIVKNAEEIARDLQTGKFY